MTSLTMRAPPSWACGKSARWIGYLPGTARCMHSVAYVKCQLPSKWCICQVPDAPAAERRLLIRWERHLSVYQRFSICVVMLVCINRLAR